MVTNNNLKGLIAPRIRQARIDSGLTVSKLADKLSVSEKAPPINQNSDIAGRVKQWDNGNNDVPISWIPALCDALSCDAGYLFGEYSEKNRQAADVCAYTGLSENAVHILHQLNTGRPLSKGVTKYGYTIDNLSLLCDLISHRLFLPFFNEIALYLADGGALPDKAYSADITDLSDSEYERFMTWAKSRGLIIESRSKVSEMHLEKACFYLKEIYMEILEKGRA